MALLGCKGAQEGLHGCFDVGLRSEKVGCVGASQSSFEGAQGLSAREASQGGESGR